jgi:hypothetical protein
MKINLGDSIIDDDIKNDESHFTKEELDLQFTNSFIYIVHQDSIINDQKFREIIPPPIKLETEEVSDYSVIRDTRTIYNTYRFTAAGIPFIEDIVYHIWWDHDKENRKPIKAGFNLGVIVEHPDKDTSVTTEFGLDDNGEAYITSCQNVDYETRDAHFQESFHNLHVVDNKSSLKDSMKSISDKINEFAEKAP